MNNAYSHLKAFRHKDVIAAISNGVPSRLPHVELILSDLCQQHCKFCAYRLEGYASNQLFDERRMIKTEKALEIIDDCAEIGVQAIQFTGGGEPTLHPAFDEIIRHVASYGIKSSLVSNGVRIDQNRANILGNCSWIRISLDAATEETYCSMRKVHKKHWEAAKNSIIHLRKMKSDYGYGTNIGVGFVVTPDNWNEVTMAARLAKSLGADNFRISAQFSNENEKLFESFHGLAVDKCKTAELYGDENFTVYNRFGDRIEDLKHRSPDDRLCGYQFFTTYIGADLNVYRCCGYAYNERGLLGSIASTRFKDFWMSQERFNKQMSFDGRGCDLCQFRRINSALAYALEPTPQLHEEFV